MWRNTSKFKERRRVLRKGVQWVGHYWVEGHAELRFPCIVLDVSHAGAGLALLGSGPVEEAEHVIIEIERIGATPVLLRLHGTARDVTGSPADGAVRVGVNLVFDGVYDKRISQTLFSQ